MTVLRTDRRRVAPWLLGSLALGGAAFLFDCVGDEPPIPATGNGDASMDVTTGETGADTSTPMEAGGEAGDGGGESSTVDSGADAADTGVADVVAHDGPRYSPPVETNTNMIDAAANIFNNDTAVTVGGSNVVVALDGVNGGTLPGTRASTNGGVAFGAQTPLTTTGACMPYGYPCAARDTVNGNVYVAALGTNSGFSVFNQIALLTSTNGGTSFDGGINSADPALAAGDYTDVPAIAVDNAAGAGQGVVYVTYTRYGSATDDIHVSAYASGGFTYTTPVNVTAPDQASLSWIAVGPNHYVYVVYYGVTGGSPYLGFVKSSNQGASFTTGMSIAPLHMPFVAGHYNGDLGLNGVGPDGGATATEFYASPQIVANPVSGALYVSYADATMGADKANVYFVHSEDGGSTWSTPVQVNDDTTTNDQFLPAIAVSPDGKRLAIDFYDRRNDPANLSAFRYGATATIDGTGKVTFDPNFKVSPSSFPVTANVYNSIGHFSIHTGMDADSTYFYDSFTDGTGTGGNAQLARYGVLY